MVLTGCIVFGQSSFDYQIQLNPKTISGLPGLHSFAFGQHDGKWLIIGGRVDGIHARQPFNAFPGSGNNTTIYVVDANSNASWSASITALPVALKEHLQATNYNFYQDGNTLYLIGGYAYSESVADHITFNKLTAVDVPGLINAVVNGTSIASFFSQIADDNFAVTGGQLGKIGTTFYLVGGNRFDGRYNPMNNPTFTQVYTNSIRRFELTYSAGVITVSNFNELTDAIHLHRRDFNLVPQIFPDGSPGYTLSSGVFQINNNLPFLYPVDINAGGYEPQTLFNQYLSNYHSAKAALYETGSNKMHSLFFGGMSRYYYNGTTLIQDDNVPFVNTISRVTRLSDGSLHEFQQPETMPALKGASAEFILNKDLPHYENEVIRLDDISENEFVIGHIVGGLQSSSLNPFTVNQTSQTSANATVYEVKLIRSPNLHTAGPNGENPFTMQVIPNPTQNDTVKVHFTMPYVTDIDYFVTSSKGQIIDDGEITEVRTGENIMHFDLPSTEDNFLILTFVFDKKYYVTQKVLRAH